MKKTILPLAIALSCAIGLHLIVLELSQPQTWLPSGAPQETTELFILKPTTPADNPPSASQQKTTLQGLSPDNTAHISQQTKASDATEKSADAASQNFFFNHQQEMEQETSELAEFDLNSKPNLLQWEDKNADMEATTELAPEVFSKKLREQIEQAKQDQQAYLKGQLKETEYQITEDADGTKYVNIEGVCWRIPEPGSEQAWAIVFAGCNGQTETFHFELNIAPSTFLGPDAIFPITE